jgi:MFS family permease
MMFRAFQNRNYRFFFTGQAISQIGTWMQRTAVSWVVYDATHSPFMLGLTMFAQQFPSFLFSLPGGIIADRYNRHKLLLLTQASSMVQAALLAILLFTGQYSITGIILLSVLLGIINAFDLPARQPLVHELVTDKADIPNALAMNASLVNLARLVGPALSGIVLESFGAGICFLLNAISFLAVLTSLLLMKLPKPEIKPRSNTMLTELKEGFVYLKQTPSISITLLMFASLSLLVLPYDTLIPVFAKQIFKGDATTFGYIYSFIGLGAISGTLLLALVKKEKNLPLLVIIHTILLGIGLLFFSQISNFPTAMVFAALTGCGAMSLTTACLTIVQLQVAPHMRGRMMSFVGLAYYGMLPLGSLLVGILSQEAGAPITLLCQGIMALLIFAVFAKSLSTVRKAGINRLEEQAGKNR